jgi:hypothetical protein
VVRIFAIVLCLLGFVVGQVLAVFAGDEKFWMQSYAILLTGISLLLVYYLTSLSKQYLLSAFAVILIAPIWFLYLEAILPDGNCWLLPADDVIETLSYSSFFLFIFSLAYQFKMPAFAARLHERNFLRVIHPNLLPLFGLIFTLFLILIIFARYDFNWETVKAAYLGGRSTGSGGIIKRGGIGGYEVFLQPAGFMAPIIPTIAALSWVQFGKEPKSNFLLRVGVTTCALLLVFIMFLGGSRGNMAIYLAGPAAIWWLFGRNLGKLTFIALSLVVSLGLIGIWEYQKIKRFNLLEGVDNVSDIVEQTSFNPAKTHRDNNLYLFTLNVMYMPDPYPYKGFGELYYYAVNPIPRAIWKNKPKGIQESADTFAIAKGPVTKGPLRVGTASLSATIISDGFTMLHLVGISVYALIFGIAASMWDRIGQQRLMSTKLYFILNSAWIFWMLWGFRSAFAFVTGMYSVWGAYLGCFILARFAWPVQPDQDPEEMDQSNHLPIAEGNS